jgi:valine--pyruvate aminotransferase
MFSTFGTKFTNRSGILELMDDLGQALTTRPDMRMLGGGNPAPVPAIQAIWRQRLREMLAAEAPIDKMLGNYDPPQGNPHFRSALAGLLRRTYGWDVGAEHIAVTTGGQTAFFYLFNLLAGPQPDGSFRKVLLPLAPEYIGYADQGLAPGMFVACPPRITYPLGEAEPRFKYEIDFAAVRQALAAGDIACMAVSRPTNPSGNVLTDAEMEQLSILADAHGIPLIVDNAYGAPFPNIIFTETKPSWGSNTILTMSLSKLGLPGSRTAMVVAPPAIASALGSLTAIAGLSNGNVGQQIVLPMLESGEILRLGPEILHPFYAQRSQQAQALVDETFQKKGIPYRLHVSEGAFFHWLWLPELRIPARELYAKLKEQNVLVVPGEYFFFGLPENADQEPWQHRQQCLRLNYAQPTNILAEAFQIIAETAAVAG